MLKKKKKKKEKKRKGHVLKDEVAKVRELTAAKAGIIGARNQYSVGF